MRQPDAKKHFQTLQGENPGGLSYEELSVGSNFRENMVPRYAIEQVSLGQERKNKRLQRYDESL